MHIQGVEWDGVDCFDLNQGWVKERVLVKAVVDFWIYKTLRISYRAIAYSRELHHESGWLVGWLVS
jgi:hypothetical protein